jgi:hypothetical protein
MVDKVEVKEDAVEDIKSLSNAMSVKDLATLDKSDPTAAAALRSQMNWENDAKKLFKGESEEDRHKRELLAEMDARDGKAARERADAEARQAKAEEIKNLDESLGYLVQEQEDLKLRQAETANEIKRLQSLRKGG